MLNIAAWFAQQGWPCEEVEPGVWHSSFTGERGERYDLYVLAAEDWVHFAVSPLLPGNPAGEAERLSTALLQLNQNLRLARLALDADGDLNLLTDLPLAHLNSALFGLTLDLLAYYTAKLAPELRLLLADPQHQSILFDK